MWLTYIDLDRFNLNLVSTNDNFKNMKADIHPKYNDNANFSCACGATFNIGSILEKVEVEICSQCHPFYTGLEKTLDTTGRVDRFKKKMAKVAK